MIRHSSSKVVFVICFFLTFFFQSFGHAGLLYSTKDNIPDVLNDILVSIDTTSLEVTEVGHLGVSSHRGGLAFDPHTDTLYMVNGWVGTGLYRVDRLTGAAILVGAHGIDRLSGLAFDSTNNVLYAATQQSLTNPGLYRLNPNTGVATLINAAVEYTALAYDSVRDRLLGTFVGTGDIHEIDRNTGYPNDAIHSGLLGASQGMAYDGDLDFFWEGSSSQDLVSYDSDFASQTIHLTNSGIALEDLAYVSEGGFAVFADFMLKKGDLRFGSSVGVAEHIKLDGSFSLGATSDGVNPVTEDVAVHIGMASITIPAGSFLSVGSGFSFVGSVGGAEVEMTITSVGFNAFEFGLELVGVDALNTSNPIGIILSIGNDEGSTVAWLEGKLKLPK